MSVRSFQDPNFPQGMDRILPFVGGIVSYDQFESGSSDIATLPSPPANSLLISGAWYNDVPFTVGGGDSTALGLTLGDAGSANEILATANLVGMAASVWSTLGAVPTKYGQFTLEATAYVPIATFTATGGTPNVTHADAGRGAACLFYAQLPDGAKLMSMLPAAKFL
jgi:hypothetical protein